MFERIRERGAGKIAPTSNLHPYKILFAISGFRGFLRLLKVPEPINPLTPLNTFPWNLEQGV